MGEALPIFATTFNRCVQVNARVDHLAGLGKLGHEVTVATPYYDRSPYAEPNGIQVAGDELHSAVYPVAKPTHAAGYADDTLGGLGRRNRRRHAVASVRVDVHDVARLPFTLRVGSAATAPWPRSASVVPSAAVMVPPLRSSALAGMLIPSSSRSPSCTV